MLDVWHGPLGGGEGDGRGTMSSAAFSLLLKESLDATPPDLVPPTAPINQNQTRVRSIDRDGEVEDTCVVCD